MTLVNRLALAAALFLPLAATGCGEDGPASPATPADPAPTAQAEEPAGGEDSEPGPTVTDVSFELRATASGPYASGEQGTFEVRLAPRGEYHVNEDYPMTVTVSGPEGLTLPSAPLGTDDAAEHGEALARFEVPFTAAGAGEHTVRCEVDFAVCTPEACVPDHRTLALALPVQ